MMTDRLYLALRDLLNLLSAIAGHGLSQILISCKVRTGQMRRLLFYLSVLACHRASNNIFEAGNHFGTFRAFVRS